MREVMPVDFPVMDGREASGVVDEVGPGVTDAAVGDEVFGFAVGGAAAERTVFEGGRPQVHVPRTFPFAEEAEAHRLSQDGHVRGKLVLLPEDGP